jgi:hypothetical protein
VGGYQFITHAVVLSLCLPNCFNSSLFSLYTSNIDQQQMSRIMIEESEARAKAIARNRDIFRTTLNAPPMPEDAAVPVVELTKAAPISELHTEDRALAIARNRDIFWKALNTPPKPEDPEEQLTQMQMSSVPLAKVPYHQAHERTKLRARTALAPVIKSIRDNSRPLWNWWLKTS